MSAQHTPGPWEVGEEGSSFLLVHAGGVVLADCDLQGINSFEECSANAKLIAEAPEMAEALRQIAYLRPAGDVDTCKTPRALVKRMEEIALAALAKIGAGS